MENMKFIFFSAIHNKLQNNIFIEIFLVAIFPVILRYICNLNYYNITYNLEIRDLFNSLFRKKNSILIEGKKCTKLSDYITRTDNLFSDRFYAFWHHINKSAEYNKSVYSLKEYANTCNDEENYNYNRSNIKNEEKSRSKKMSDIFVINQYKSFNLEKDIYCKVLFENNNYDNNDKNRKLETENITIYIYSYKKSVNQLRYYIDSITNKFIHDIESLRNNKKYIYTYLGKNDNDRYFRDSWDNERAYINYWEECEFTSNRNFKNLFFKDKNFLIDKLDYFIKNKDWYDQEGHPYTLGIGLHGPPGTGKTSVIKCIANKLDRHVIIIPLSKIKTQREFNNSYFEKIYNRFNNSIDFDDKIIVFEDIDCMSDIVKSRQEKKCDNKNLKNLDNIETNITNQNILLNNLSNKIDSLGNSDIKNDSVMININDKSDNDKITLSYILNIIDGIRETPGRILIMTSNDYNSLDPALIRPGRIDITLEMKNADKNIIGDMYKYFYNEDINNESLNKLVDYSISPAKIVNIRLQSNSKEEFIKSLLETQNI
tara:strand:+ start:1388 stop:3013 length:1626 start_codon:yes stop_codon:yes gene_type:complete